MNAYSDSVRSDNEIRRRRLAVLEADRPCYGIHVDGFVVHLENAS